MRERYRYPTVKEGNIGNFPMFTILSKFIEGIVNTAYIR